MLGIFYDHIFFWITRFSQCREEANEAKAPPAMAPLVEVESKVHLDRLVDESAKLVVCCFVPPVEHVGGADTAVAADTHSAVLAFSELSQRLTSVVCCRVDRTVYPQLLDAANDLLGDGRGRYDGQELAGNDWIFFRGGERVSQHKSSEFCRH